MIDPGRFRDNGRRSGFLDFFKMCRKAIVVFYSEFCAARFGALFFNAASLSIGLIEIRFPPSFRRLSDAKRIGREPISGLMTLPIRQNRIDDRFFESFYSLVT